MSNSLRKLKRNILSKKIACIKCCGKLMTFKESHSLYVCENCGKKFIVGIDLSSGDSYTPTTENFNQ